MSNVAEVLETHLAALRKVGVENPEKALHGSIQKEHEVLTKRAEYYGGRRWAAVSIFMPISLAATGLSCQYLFSRDPKLGVLGLFGAVMVQAIGVALYFRIRVIRRLVRTKLLVLDDVLGYMQLKSVDSLQDGNKDLLSIKNILLGCLLLQSIAAIASCVVLLR